MLTDKLICSLNALGNFVGEPFELVEPKLAFALARMQMNTSLFQQQLLTNVYDHACNSILEDHS